MMIKRFIHSSAAAMLAGAGIAVSSSAGIASQNQDRGEDRRYGNKASQQMQSRTYVFRSAEDLMDEPLSNARGKELARIDDLIIDRGSGRIASVIIQEGGFLGFGGTHVAIPMGALTIDKDDGTVTLNVASALLESEDVSLPRGWQRLDDDWEERLDEIAPTDPSLYQQLPEADPDAEIKRIRGTITEIDRVDLGETRHWLAVRVGSRDAQGQNRQSGENMNKSDGQWVVLGPAWYAVGHTGVPVRGQEAEIHAFSGPGDMMHAKAAVFDGEEIQYRDERLRPMWTDRSIRSDSRRQPSHYVLLSDIMDREVYWGNTDKEVGDIDDVLIEMTTGHVAILSVSPDDDWWGQEVGPRAMPFDVARFGREDVTLDASRQMMAGARVIPDDLSNLSDPKAADRVFVVFGVASPAYQVSYK